MTTLTRPRLAENNSSSAPAAVHTDRTHPHDHELLRRLAANLDSSPQPAWVASSDLGEIVPNASACDWLGRQPKLSSHRFLEALRLPADRDLPGRVTLEVDGQTLSFLALRIDAADDHGPVAAYMLLA